MYTRTHVFRLLGSEYVVKLFPNHVLLMGDEPLFTDEYQLLTEIMSQLRLASRSPVLAALTRLDDSGNFKFIWA